MRSDTAVRQIFLSTSGLDSYSVSFPVYAAAELVVKVGENPERTLELGTDYSVTNVSAQAGAKVNLLRALAAGTPVCVMSKLPYAQELALGSVTAIRPSSLETQLDRTAQQIQQLAQALERKVGILDTSTGNVPPVGWFEERVSEASAYASAASGSATFAAEVVSGFDDYAESRGSAVVSSGTAALNAVYASGMEDLRDTTSSGSAELNTTCASAMEDVNSTASSAVATMSAASVQFVGSASAYAQSASGYAETASGAAALVSTVWAAMQQGVTTASAAIPAGTEIGLPAGMKYIVGKQHLLVALDGMLVDSESITEVGATDTASVKFKLDFAVDAGQKIHAIVGSLGAMPEMSGQSGKYLGNDGTKPIWLDGPNGLPD